MPLPLGGAPVAGRRQRKIHLSGSGQFGFGGQQRRSGGAVEVGTAIRGQQLQDVAILLSSGGHDAEHAFDETAARLAVGSTAALAP